MSHLHSDSYNEHLLYAQRLGDSSPSPPSSGDENPQEAPPPAAGDLPALPTESEGTFVQRYLGLIVAAMLALSLIGLVFGIIPYFAVHAAYRDRYNEMLYWTAGAFVLIAVPVSVHGIIQHLVNVSGKGRWDDLARGVAWHALAVPDVHQCLLLLPNYFCAFLLSVLHATSAEGKSALLLFYLGELLRHPCLTHLIFCLELCAFPFSMSLEYSSWFQSFQSKRGSLYFSTGELTHLKWFLYFRNVQVS